MPGCCHHDATPMANDARYRRVLWTVIALNLAMFAVEMFAGIKGKSLALRADALDFLGDGVTYGMSLAVLGAALRVRATIALIKGSRSPRSRRGSSAAPSTGCSCWMKAPWS